jgi:aspartokinase-like uncharacterized kinase
MIEYCEENIVVKIGGASLFGGSGFLNSMHEMVHGEPRRRVFVLFGGGETVESMRSLHDRFPQLNPEQMHWRCVRLLDATWEIGCELFPGAVGITDWDDLMTEAVGGQPGSIYLVCASAFYSPAVLSRIPQELRPAHDWNTTTDALSWVLSKLIGAAELRIAKRCPVDSQMTIARAARSGMIDSELVRLVGLSSSANTPSIRFVQLKESP